MSKSIDTVSVPSDKNGHPPARGVDLGGGFGGVGVAVADQVRLVQDTPALNSNTFKYQVWLCIRSPIDLFPNASHWPAHTGSRRYETSIEQCLQTIILAITTSHQPSAPTSAMQCLRLT